MRSAFLVLLLGFSSAASAENSVLNYRYGNQIFGSELQISNLGNISHKERDLGDRGPFVTQVKERPLNNGQIQILSGLISMAAQGKIIRKPCDGKFGEKYGLLTVSKDGITPVLIRSDEVLAGMKCVISVNASPAAREIEKIVYSYVKVQAPKLN